MPPAEIEVDLSEDRLFPCGWGLLYQVVCAPKSWSAERIAKEVTHQNPPGTSSDKWVISVPEKRKGKFNKKNCIPCPDAPNRQHWLLNC